MHKNWLFWNLFIWQYEQSLCVCVREREKESGGRENKHDQNETNKYLINIIFRLKLVGSF